MKIAFFGLTVSSSWGNGHATPYRALFRALARRGHQITFYEQDVEYYALRRDFTHCDFCRLELYSRWEDIRAQAVREAAESDAIVVGSYCPGGARISDEILALADYFCRSSRLRIDNHFAGTQRNVDKRGYRLTQELLAGKYAMLRDGIV